MVPTIKLSPSILAADFGQLGLELEEMERCGADYAHIDVMDGVFVPNISFGFPVLGAARASCGLVMDVHLMITQPERYIERFADAGADILTIHTESTENPAAVVEQIRQCGKKAAVAVKPNTPVEEIFPYLSMLDMALIMTVEPGFGGQSLIPHTVEKVRRLRAEADCRGLALDIEVDGGIHAGNAAEIASAGANVIVIGTAAFRAPDRAAALSSIRRTAETSFLSA